MLRIGVTGHRILTEREKVKRSIDVVLNHIAKNFPDNKWLLLSSLAEGADCMVVEEAMTRFNVTLLAVLPAPEEQYFSTFIDKIEKTKAETFLKKAKKIIMPASSTIERAYQIAGQYIVTHSDIMIAIWDGQDAQGIGGSGEIVALARAQGKPIAWIHAGNRVLGTTIATTLGEEQGIITFERFPTSH